MDAEEERGQMEAAEAARQTAAREAAAALLEARARRQHSLQEARQETLPPAQEEEGMEGDKQEQGQQEQQEQLAEQEQEAELEQVAKQEAQEGEEREGVTDGRGEGRGDEGLFECNICLDTAAQPVISKCGHLYCWPCIYQWLHSGRSETPCPVCKSGLDRDALIPLYGRGGDGADPRAEAPALPPRPAGQRQAPRAAWGAAPSFHFAAGLGPMPGLFGMHFGTFGPQAQPGQPLTPAQEQQALLSKVFFLIATAVLLTTVLLS